MRISLRELADNLNGELLGVSPPEELRQVSTDTRTLAAGDCFVALRGPQFDGHDFAAQAAERGASCLVVDHACGEAEGVAQLVVRDTLEALGEMARLWRMQNAHIPLAVITGSSGKTTTKEMAARIVGASRHVLVTQGNLNNLIGVPRMLFELEAGHEAAILELGMNAPGELRRLVEIAMPQCVALTNITNAHIGMFGSQEKLYDAKTESLRQSGDECVLVMNADDALSRRAREEYARGRRVVSFGMADGAQVAAASLEALSPYGYSFDLQMEGEPCARVELRMFGKHNVQNALAAAAVGHFFGIACHEIARELSSFRPSQNRSEVAEVHGWYVIKDYYNASPAAVEQALGSLKDFQVPGRRYAVLADMLELGELEEFYHEEVGRQAARAGLEKLYTLGERGAIVGRAASQAGACSEHLADAEAVAKRLKSELRPGDLLLIKGSRLMKLEKIYDLLA